HGKSVAAWRDVDTQAVLKHRQVFVVLAAEQ
ncbi:MAG: hypothetical protein RJA94_1246, partial [Pseudomonadota bacterium]